MSDLPEFFSELPFDQFRKEYPDHAQRVTQAVNTWYAFSVNQYIHGGPSLIRERTATFLDLAKNKPQEVFVNGIPLSFATEQKIDAFLVKFKHIAPREYIEKFANWFNLHLSNDAEPKTIESIKLTSQNHILNWLNHLSYDSKNSKELWDDVDTNLRAISEGNISEILPASAVLISSIEAAVIEQFISREYAPNDLFGPQSTGFSVN